MISQNIAIQLVLKSEHNLSTPKSSRSNKQKAFNFNKRTFGYKINDTKENVEEVKDNYSEVLNQSGISSRSVTLNKMLFFLFILEFQIRLMKFQKLIIPKKTKLLLATLVLKF